MDLDGSHRAGSGDPSHRQVFRCGRLSSLVAALAMVSVASPACTPAVRLRASDRARLRATVDLAVAQVVSREPWVDCPGDWGDRTWSAPGGGMGMRPRPSSPIALASYGRVARQLTVPAGSTWEDVQDQRTRSLRSAPPRDPARATADAFLALSREEADPVSFAESTIPVKATDRIDLERRFGSSPVLVFEATRWVLVGCFSSYQPWFDVRATLVDAASGSVLWRETCGGLYPPGPFDEASPAELEADGKALYAQRIDARARQCADELFRSFLGR